MIIPKMTEDELAKKILTIKPEISIIICTEFSERINKNRVDSIGVKGFLMKPDVVIGMAQMVRKVLYEAKTS